ncbi:hypothetical protein VNO80_03198 [Phaseolus coccineus]|uniref:Uncharacterized protein n=1 Tax=Phaseolus coccineus TaxID=3886 RepID=A0AAN9RM93_PHACN
MRASPGREMHVGFARAREACGRRQEETSVGLQEEETSVLRNLEVATASGRRAPYAQPRMRPPHLRHQHRSTLRACATDVAAPSVPVPPKSPASLLPRLILTSFELIQIPTYFAGHRTWMENGNTQQNRVPGAAIGTVGGVGGGGIFVTIFPSSLDLIKKLATAISKCKHYISLYYTGAAIN